MSGALAKTGTNSNEKVLVTHPNKWIKFTDNSLKSTPYNKPKNWQPRSQMSKQRHPTLRDNEESIRPNSRVSLFFIIYIWLNLLMNENHKLVLINIIKNILACKSSLFKSKLWLQWFHINDTSPFKKSWFYTNCIFLKF